ncbi:nucleoside hydrolase [Deinococcus oregonensis]|uniref:Nucleoside hydrolase n=1 Tax=Deinococcus oregonensis TaxID=1805970 RepID=A0ABV6ASJ1_9DEIO
MRRSVLLIALAFTVLGCQRTKPGTGSTVNLIIDTDIQFDVDDVGALAVAHALADRGEANLLGIMVETSDAFNPRAVDVINTYYGRPDLPIGQSGTDPLEPSEQQAYQRLLAERFPNDVGSGKGVPNAVNLYRQLLAAQPDQSVVIASIGFLNVLSALLDSPPDAVSVLSGFELASRKVRLLAVMGGQYPAGRDDFNFWSDRPAASRVINDWPGRVMFSGLGEAVRTGPRLSRATPVLNPVRLAYENYNGVDAQGVSKSRSSWDQVVVLAAVRGLTPYFREAGTGSSNAYDPDTGINSFVGNTDKEHSYLIQAVTNEQLATILEDLMVQPPGTRGASSGSKPR